MACMIPRIWSHTNLHHPSPRQSIGKWLICARRPCPTRRISRAGRCGTIRLGKLPQPGNRPKVSDDVPRSLLALGHEGVERILGAQFPLGQTSQSRSKDWTLQAVCVSTRSRCCRKPFWRKSFSWIVQHCDPCHWRLILLSLCHVFFDYIDISNSHCTQLEYTTQMPTMHIRQAKYDASNLPNYLDLHPEDQKLGRIPQEASWRLPGSMHWIQWASAWRRVRHNPRTLCFWLCCRLRCLDL